MQEGGPVAQPPNYSFEFAAKTVCLSTAFRESDSNIHVVRQPVRDVHVVWQPVQPRFACTGVGWDTGSACSGHWSVCAGVGLANGQRIQLTL